MYVDPWAKSARERYIRVEAIDIMMSAVRRNACVAERRKEPGTFPSHRKQEHTVLNASDVSGQNRINQQNPSQ
jgi:hypothetical protein